MADDKNETGDKPATDGPSKEDFEKMKAALAKANEEAKNYRLDARAKGEELSKLKDDHDSSKSEMDKIQEQIANLTQRAETAEREAMVAKVAQAKKIPAALAGRLAGASLEELEADADTLIEALHLGDEKSNGDRKDEDVPKLGPFTRPTESLRPGASSEGDKAPDYEKIAEKIASRNKI